MILTFTDFGRDGPYLAEMHLAIRRESEYVAILDLVSDLAPFRPLEAGHLLAALSVQAPAESVFLCVVDPGVGSARMPVALQAEGRWFVGPDNGLLDVVAARAKKPRWWQISWRPENLSASFHGRDLFAPVAARLAAGEALDEAGCRPLEHALPADADLEAIVYVDRYGNCITGLRAVGLAENKRLRVGARLIPHARTFSAIEPGAAFWYGNSSGLVEFAVNQGRADRLLELGVGSPFGVVAS